MKEINGQVNIGTEEAPVRVPEKALKPKTAEGREYWEMIAVGSVVLDTATLDKLIKRVNEQDSSKG